MCGRYTFVPGDNFNKRFHIAKHGLRLKPSYNVFPGASMPIIIRQNDNHAVLMKWGLIPFWAKDPKIGNKMINARSETLADKPSFRKPFRTQRCLVPASGFYEWKKTNGSKIPHYVHLANNKLFAFAGLYDKWRDAKGKEMQTYTIITTQPNSVIKNIHDRMPVVLKKQDENTWLDQNTSDIGTLLPLLKPYAEADMEAYAVSKQVNTPNINSPILINRQEQTSLL